MKRKDVIKYYVPCSEAQRTKIEAIRNERRLKAYKSRIRPVAARPAYPAIHDRRHDDGSMWC